MNDNAVLVAILLASVLPILVGWLVGGLIERRHLADLSAREAALSDIIASDIPADGAPAAAVGLLTTEVVIGTNALKVFAAKLKALIGGEVRGFAPVMMRARREALLRLKEQAREAGYGAIDNVRIEWVEIGAMMAAIQAYGTGRRLPAAQGGAG